MNLMQLHAIISTNKIQKNVVLFYLIVCWIQGIIWGWKVQISLSLFGHVLHWHTLFMVRYFFLVGIQQLPFLWSEINVCKHTTAYIPLITNVLWSKNLCYSFEILIMNLTTVAIVHFVITIFALMFSFNYFCMCVWSDPLLVIAHNHNGQLKIKWIV